MYIPHSYLETKVNNIKFTLFIGLDGDYHVTAENMDHDHELEFQGEFTHEVFDEFEDAKEFYDEQIKSEQNEG